MQGGHFLEYALAAALAIALLYAAWTDLVRREIDNWLNGAIVIGAPLFWYSLNLGLVGIGIQLAIALLVFLVLLFLFWIGQMGGGDVKLLTALALWIWPVRFMQLTIVMAIAGMALTIVLYAWHRARRRTERVKVPYGIAISIGGLWVLADKYIPIAQKSGLLG